jgi:RimJ/RimL family protein N-acetyltransferase
VNDPDAVITSERLRMPLLTREQLQRIADGDGASVGRELGSVLPAEWLDSVKRLAGYRAHQLGERPQDAGWLLRPIILAENDEVVGYLNFHRAPDERGMVEIGYTLLPDARGRGYAIEAVRAAFEWAQRAHGARVMRASVAPTNERSINLITKLGMTHVGEQWDDEDGRELIYEREAWVDGDA